MSGKQVKVLVKSSWQSVNIGDVGHTPGLLRLIEQAMPNADITLWAGNLDYGVDEMLKRDFPNVQIYVQRANEAGMPTSSDLLQAWKDAEYYIHGSGPSLVAEHATRAWANTGRPFGVYGVTLESFDANLLSLLNQADFIFCRDTDSLKAARAAKVQVRYLEFAPDAAFATNDRDDALANAYLNSVDLAPREYICVLSRLRYTPYFKIQNREPDLRERERQEISEAHKESDHEPLRRLMIDWVRETGKKVLLCPEMTYEIELTKEELHDRMPEDVRPNVVWRDTYWRPDEASSVYANAIAVVSMEMHSPILACAVNTPAFYLRVPTDTCKGQMWRDLGLPEWIFEVEDTDGSEMSAALLQLVNDPRRAQEKLAHAQSRVKHLQQRSMDIVRECVSNSSVNVATVL
ncbi:polysaccharide pyruvyl transferase family protein [Coraliomargarita algicola]|uniref:Polysaccharide pyruvyl transferase family protein n=1 Tax=Coraliomargarita algicola TaxID=3092156 RepID=A0ABZ0RKQ4_9BACT|nr:polysaccharide pyruvyl transferase family protein [Coraliomargarita sp. J2-16]WPJ95360.1 polysaccharide pyruvyl transferase family protein [Coraliomargarita sp. J2-16]